MSQASQEIARQYANAAVNKKNWGALAHNVLSEGLSGDGVTDDTAKLQALINKAIAEGRKTLLFPHGSYYVTSLTNAEKVDFVGDNSKFVGGYSGTIGDLGGFATLKAETTQSINDLKTNKAEKSEVAQKADTSYVNTQIAAVASGSPKGVYATLEALQTAFPTGNNNIYVITADGNWYYWNGSVWTVGGTYQTTGIAVKSVSQDKTDFLIIGKNLLDISKVTTGFYVDNNNGNLVANAGNKATDFITLEPNTTYTLSSQISKDLSQLAFYNSAKTYVSGLPNTGLQESITFTTASSVYYMRLSIPVTVTDGVQLEKGSSMTTYESFIYRLPNLAVDKTNMGKEAVADVNIDPSSNIVLKKIGKNLLDITKVTAGYFVNYMNGNLVANADNKATDFVSLLPNTAYTLSSQISKDLSQLAFYNNAKVYASGIANTGTNEYVTFTTGANVYYMRLSIPVTVKDGIQLEKGSVMTSFETYGITISKSDLPSELFPSNNVISVKKDGTGDFDNLRGALEYVSVANADNRYEVKVYEGTYDVFADYTTAEINTSGFIGPIKPPYVDIIGIGDRDKITFKGTLPYANDVYPATTKQMVSTLNLYGEGSLENLTVTADNMRYAVHDDWNYQDMVRRVKNCRFVHYKGGSTHFGGKQPWGEGSWSGQQFYFEDCIFETDWDYYAYTSHNNTGFSKPSHHKFVNCDFITKGSEQGLRFESLGSGQVDTVELINCRYNGILMYANPSYTTHIDHKLKGAGNTIAPVTFTATDGLQYTYEMIGETIRRVNLTGSTIPKGTIVRFGSVGHTFIPLGAFDPIFYVGIAMEDIPNGATGIVRVAGYMPIADTGLMLALGDKVALSNGTLIKTAGSDYIGYVQINNFIKLGS